MAVFRASEGDATRFRKLLLDSGLTADIERYGTTRTVYLVVHSNRPDIVRLARSAGPSVRQVLALDSFGHPSGDQNDPPP